MLQSKAEVVRYISLCLLSLLALLSPLIISLTVAGLLASTIQSVQPSFISTSSLPLCLSLRFWISLDNKEEHNRKTIMLYKETQGPRWSPLLQVLLRQCFYEENGGVRASESKDHYFALCLGMFFSLASTTFFLPGVQTAKVSTLL